MTSIESTPEMAAGIYRAMERRLEIVRRRLRRPLTLAEKVLLGHLDDPEQQELAPGKSYLLLRPDRVVFQDLLGQTGILQFMQSRRERVAIPTSIHCDHLIQARHTARQDLRNRSAKMPRSTNSCAGPRPSTTRLLGAGRRDHASGRAGELRLPRRADHRHRLHTPNAGGLGACAVGVGGAMRWRP